MSIVYIYIYINYFFCLSFLFLSKSNFHCLIYCSNYSTTQHSSKTALTHCSLSDHELPFPLSKALYSNLFLLQDIHFLDKHSFWRIRFGALQQGEAQGVFILSGLYEFSWFHIVLLLLCLRMQSSYFSVFLIFSIILSSIVLFFLVTRGCHSY